MPFVRHPDLRGAAPAVLRRVWAWLPNGNTMPSEEWRRRHRAISLLLWAHVVVVPVYGVMRGEGLLHALAESGVVAVLALGAVLPGLRQTARSVLVTLGLVGASAILTHFSHGLIEMHFHFFVVVAVISLYQSWVPFLVALGFVVAHHTIGGELAPESVFNHPSAVNAAWHWALIHGGFILAESIACLVTWRLNEIAMESERGARRQMEKAHSDLASAQALSNIGSWDWDAESGQVWWSDELYRIFGRDQKAFTPSLESFMEQVAPKDVVMVQAALEAATTQGKGVDLECTILRPDGTERIVHARGDRVVHDDAASAKIMGTCQDITDRKALEQEIEHRAFHDELTGLANRALFLNRLDHALAISKRTNGPVSLLYVDLDDFKTVNDNLGHATGDELLIGVAARLRGTIRASDTVARLGGDEFAVLLENTGRNDATVVADKLLNALQEPVAVSAGALLARASIGIAAASPGDEPGDVLRHADIAMYAAKRHGKHTHRLFTEGMHSSLTARMQLEAELAAAIEHGQFTLHCQPLVDLVDDHIDGVEALVRWDHPHRGLLPPSEFIPVAEEMGLITALGEWVLFQATQEIITLQKAVGRPLYVSVNVAAPQLHTDIVGTVRAALDNAGLDPEHLLLEITETSLMGQDAATVTRLSVLRDMGVRIAIDDFGTGYSSLAYLRELPIDHLKIDRAFVQDVTQGPEASALAHSIIKLGKVFGLRVVGEGIETEEQAATLRQLGCHGGQGYHYHRPTDLESLTGVLANMAEAVPLA